MFHGLAATWQAYVLRIYCRDGRRKPKEGEKQLGKRGFQKTFETVAILQVGLREVGIPQHRPFIYSWGRVTFW